MVVAWNSGAQIDTEFNFASCAKDAIAIALKGKINFIFLDIELPDKSGLEILKIVKESKPDIYVVMVSGENSLDNVKQSIQAGASGFIAKPFTNGKVTEALIGFYRYTKSNPQSAKQKRTS